MPLFDWEAADGKYEGRVKQPKSAMKVICCVLFLSCASPTVLSFHVSFICFLSFTQAVVLILRPRPLKVVIEEGNDWHCVKRPETPEPEPEPEPSLPEDREHLFETNRPNFPVTEINFVGTKAMDQTDWRQVWLMALNIIELFSRLVISIKNRQRKSIRMVRAKEIKRLF